MSLKTAPFVGSIICETGSHIDGAKLTALSTDEPSKMTWKDIHPEDPSTPFEDTLGGRFKNALDFVRSAAFMIGAT